MTHKEVFRWFQLYFPAFKGDKLKSWYPNGKKSIRILQTDGQEFIFHFDNSKKWSIEAVERRNK